MAWHDFLDTLLSPITGGNNQTPPPLPPQVPPVPLSSLPIEQQIALLYASSDASRMQPPLQLGPVPVPPPAPQSGGGGGLLGAITGGLSSGLNAVTGAASSGYNTVTGAASSGYNAASDLVGGAASGIADAARWYYDLEREGIPNVLNSGKKIGQAALDYGPLGALGAGQQQVIQHSPAILAYLNKGTEAVQLDLARQAYYQATHDGDKPDGEFDLSWNPFRTITNAMPDDAFMTRWADDPANWAAIRDAKENGYTEMIDTGAKDANGNPIMKEGKHYPPGYDAVLALYRSQIGGIAQFVFDTSMDPLNTLGVVGKWGDAIQAGGRAIGAVEDASRARRGASTALDIAGQIANAPNDLLNASGEAVAEGIKGSVKGVAKGVNYVTKPAWGGTERAYDYLVAPAAQTLANRANQELDSALSALRNSKVGAVWKRAEQGAVDPAEATIPNPDRLGNAESPNITPSEPTPGAADTTPFPQVDETGVASSADTIPVPNQVEPTPRQFDALSDDDVAALRYLAPDANGNRMIDEIWSRLSGKPDLQRQFLDRYTPYAQGHMSIMDALDETYRLAKANGENVARFAVDKPIMSTRHVAEDLMPIARDLLGDELPPYRFMNAPLGDSFKVVRDASGKVTQIGDLSNFDQGVRRLIEDAVFSEDDMVATNARFLLHRTGDPELEQIANEARRLREGLKGPESVASTKDIIGRAVPADDAPLNGETSPFSSPADESGTTPFPANPSPAPSSSPPLFSGTSPNDSLTPPIRDIKTPEDGINRMFDIGDLDAEQRDLLLKPVLVDRNGRAVRLDKDGNPILKRTEAKIKPDKNGVLTETPAREEPTFTKSAAELYVESLKMGKTEQEAFQITYDALRQTVRPWGVDSEKKLVRTLGKTLRAYRTGTNAVREQIMFNAASGPRGIIADQLGDALGLAMQGDVRTAVKTFNPRDWMRSYRMVRNAGEAAAEDFARTSTGRTINNLKMNIPRFVTTMGREEVERSGQMTVRRVAEDIGGEKFGSVIGAVHAPLASERIRDFRTALDQNRRMVAFGDYLADLLPGERDQFFANAKKGFGDLDGLRARLGDEFSPDSIREIAPEFGFSQGEAERLARDWRASVSRLEKGATAEVNKKLFSSEMTQGDEILKHFVLFHYWMTRATQRYAEMMIRNPRLAIAYYRATEGLKKEAEGKPRSVQGLVNVLDGPLGFSVFMNPTALIGTALMFRDQAYEDGDDRLFDKVTKNWSLFLNPILDSALVAAGWLNDEGADPYATYATRNLIMGITQFAVGQGWLGDTRLVQDPYEMTKRRIFAATSSWASDHGVPFSNPLTPGDNQATVKSMISNNIIDAVAAHYGIASNTPIDQWSPDAQQALVTAQQAFTSGSSGNPYADQAVKDYSTMNAARLAGGYLLPGSLRLRGTSRDQRMVAAQAGDEGARDLRDYANTATPEAAALSVAEANYRSVGADSRSTVAPGRDANDYYNRIAYGGSPPELVFTGSRSYTSQELKAMTEDERKTVADLWLMHAGLSDDRQSFFNARDDVLSQPINQAYVPYSEWAKAAREMGMDELINRSPAYRAYIDRLPEATRNDPDRLGAAAFSTDAYLATEGIRSSVYDPLETPPTLDPSKLNPVTDLGGGGGQSKPPNTREQQLVDSMNDYQIRRAEFDQLLQQYTGNPHASLDSATGANPMLANAIMTNLRAMGIDVPSIPREVQQYLDWSAMQPNGADTSPAAYYRWVDSTVANHGIGQVIPATAP